MANNGALYILAIAFLGGNKDQLYLFDISDMQRVI